MHCAAAGRIVLKPPWHDEWLLACLLQVRPFRLSQSLLYEVLSMQLPGVLLADCREYMQGLHNPSKDLHMLIQRNGSLLPASMVLAVSQHSSFGATANAAQTANQCRVQSRDDGGRHEVGQKSAFDSEVMSSAYSFAPEVERDQGPAVALYLWSAEKLPAALLQAMQEELGVLIQQVRLLPHYAAGYVVIPPYILNMRTSKMQTAHKRSCFGTPASNSWGQNACHVLA